MLILYILAALLGICLLVFAVTFVLLKINMRPGRVPELADVSVAKRTRWAPYAETVSRLILELRGLPWEDISTLSIIHISAGISVLYTPSQPPSLLTSFNELAHSGLCALIVEQYAAAPAVLIHRGPAEHLQLYVFTHERRDGHLYVD